MVAIVAGNGLGIERSSSNVLGARGQLGSASLGRANDNVTVNAATGNLVIQNTDEILVGRGPDAVINRTYNSLGAYTNLAGAADPDNWVTNTQRKIVLTGTGNAIGSTATLTDWDGSVTIFNWVSATIGYKASENPYRDDTLTWAGNVFTWTEGKSRIVQTFASNIGGRLISTTDADGNSITYGYDAATTAGKLTTVTTANHTTGQTNLTTLTYSGTNLATLVTSYYEVATATNKTLTRTRYTYDASNRLSTVTVDKTPGDNAITDANTYVTTYTYIGTTGAAAKQVRTITQSDGTSLTMTYDASGRVATMTQVTAGTATRVTSFAYDTTNRVTTITQTVSGDATVSLVSKMTYDTANRLTRIEEPAPTGGVASVTDYTYNANGDVLTAFVSEGIGGTAVARDFYQYDTNGNLTQLYRWTGTDYRVTRWTYGTKNELLTETIFANVDADGDGGVAPTGGMTSNYAYDVENHLRFMVSAEGRVTEFRYDLYGNQVAQISYSGNVYSGAFTEAAIAAWVSGTADKTRAQRIDTAYDFRLNITNVTSYSQTDAAGNGLTTANWSRMDYTYDQFGKLLTRRVSGTNDLGGEAPLTTETFVYDGLGRVISTTDIYGAVTTISINDGTRVTTISTPNDATRTMTYNIAGELLSEATSGAGISTGTISYAYDNLGRLRVKTDAVGVKTYFVYDKQSRLTGQIDGDGSLTELRYDGADRVIATIRYAAAVSAANITTLGTATTNTEIAAIRPTANAADRWAWTIYDKSGKVIETIDAVGATTAFQYDGAGRLVKATRYNYALTYNLGAGILDTYKTTPPTSFVQAAWDASVDRTSFNYYDNDGLLLGSVDEEMFVTEYVYDKSGRLVETVRYANAASVSYQPIGPFSSALPGTWAQVKASITTNASADIRNYWIYDGRGKVVATIDGEGNVTRYHYTARGDVDQEIRGQQVSANTSYTMATLPAPTGTLETTRFYRNAAGQVTSQVRTLSGGTETVAYTYDTRGRLLTQTTSETVSTETRTQRFRYDVKGRLTGSLDGVGSATLVASPTQAQIDAAINTYGTRYVYDVADRLINRIDSDGSSTTGNTTRFYYDADGQLRYEINALGEVTEHRYNVLEDKTDTFVYGTRIAAATLTTLIGGLVNSTITNAVAAIANTSLDSRSQFAYTVRGELATAYNPLYVAAPTQSNYTNLYYNTFGQLTQTLAPTDTPSYNWDNQSISFYRRGLKYSDYRQLNGNSTGSTQKTWGYDAFGRTTIEYTNNTDWQHWTQYGYDRANRLRTVTDASYDYVGYTYDARSNQISYRDRTGATTNFAYDLFNRNVTTTTAEGVVSTVKKNAYGQTIQIVDGAGRTTSYSYDKNGNLKTVTDAAGTTTNNYDNADRLISTVDAKGVVTTFTYDAANRVLTRVQDAGSGKLNLTTTFAYDAKGQTISVTDALGVLTTYAYDLKGQKTRVIQDQGAGKLNITTDFVYRADGKVTQQIDAVGTAVQRTTLFEYDTLGRLTRKTDDQGSGKLNIVTNYVWDENNNLVATSDNLARVTRFVYDLEDRLVFTVNAEGEVSETGYDNEGRAIWTRSYFNRIAAATLNGFANKITTSQVKTNVATSASDRINRTLYDGDGRATYAVDGEGYVTRRVYDGANNVVKAIRYADGTSTSNATTKANLDAVFGSAASPPATAAVTTYTYDAANRLTDITDAEGSVTHFEMDALGQITYTTVAYGTADASQTYRVFDNVGRVTQETRALGTAEQATSYFAYNAQGNITSVTDPRGFVTTRTYDNVGRMLSETVPLDGSTSATTSYLYDARGNRTRITDPRGNIGYFFYDGVDRLVRQVDPEGYVTDTAYSIGSAVASVKRYYNRTGNAAGGAAPAAHAKDATTSFVRDKADRVLSATDAEGAVESYVYDGLGNRTRVTNKLGGITDYSYDLNGRLRYEYVYANIYNSGGGLIASAYYKNRYDYDARGNTIRHYQALGLSEQLVTHYAYDRLDRLITKTDPIILGQTPVTTYQYDKRGNLVLATAADGGKTYSFYDDNNRKIAEISAVNTYSSWAYDANGNVVSQKVYATPLAHPATPGGVTTPPTGAFRETQFSYDRNNRLIESRIMNVRRATSDGTNIVWADGNLVGQNVYDAAGNLVREIDANGSSIYHFYDRNGREIAKVDQENYLTMFDRDSEGNVLRERRVINRIPVAVTTASDPYALLNNYNGGTTDRITDMVYDRMGRRTNEYRYYVDYASVGAAGGLSTGQTTSTITYAYNALGEVTLKYEATGEYTVYDYDNQGRMTSTHKTGFADFNGSNVYNRHLFYYDGNNSLVRDEEREYYSAANQRVTQYVYDGGKLRWVTDASGFTRYLWYNVMGQQTYDYYTRVKSDGTNDTTYNGNLTSYDLAGRVVSRWQADFTNNTWTTVGPVTQYSYNSFGEVTTRFVGGSVQEQFAYDNAGRVNMTTGGDGVWKFLAYDANGNNTVIMTSTGVTSLAHWSGDFALSYLANSTTSSALSSVNQTYTTAVITTYDKRNMALATIEPSRTIASAGDARVNTTQTLTRNRTYNAFGEVASETDARGNVTNFAYNTIGRLIQKQSPFVYSTGENGVDTWMRPTENYYYDLSGRLIAMTDANGYTTTRTLLANSGYSGTEAKVLKEFRPDGSAWETRYDVFGDARRSLDGLGRTTSMDYDAMGRVTQITRPSGFVDYYAYDGLGQRLKHWNSFLNTPIYGDPVWVEDGYWDYSNPYEPMWIDTSYWYTPVIGYAPAVETTDYDIQGRVSKAVNYAGDVTTYSYSWTNGVSNGLGITGGWIKSTSFATGRTASETQDSFGRMLTRTDQGGRVYTFSYNWAGQLTQSTSTGGQNISYTYYNTGRVATVFDNNGTNYGFSTSSTDATYTYDADGNRLHEKYNVTTYYYDPYGGSYPVTTNHQDAVATFDALNRMRTFTNAASASAGYVSIVNKYDAVGNVRNTNATYRVFDYTGAFTGATTTTDYWYRYDALNRFVTTKGVLVGGVISRGVGEGRDITYNLAGERATASRTLSIPGYYDPKFGYFPGYTYESREIYTYNVDGRLTQINIADGAQGPEGGTPPTATGPGTIRAAFGLDAMGRTTGYTEYNAGGSIIHNRYSIAYDLRSNVTSETSSTVKNDGYTYVTYISNAYAAGGLIYSTSQSNYRNGSYQSSSTTSTQYAYWDGAVQSQVTVYNSPTGGTHNSYFNYDANGHLSSVNIQDGRARTVTFVNDAAGQILERTEVDNTSNGDPKQYYYYFNGLRVGANGNNGNDDPEFVEQLNERQLTNANGPFRNGATGATPYADFDQSYDPINAGNPGSTAQMYVVRDGDTLQSIASAIWGDASLWYMLAEANGLTSQSILVAGQQIAIPNKVVNVRNNSSTFRPYDPNKAIGDVNPTTPTAPKPKGKKCGTFGLILLAVIAVAVTVVTAGAAVAALSPTISTIGAGISAIAAGTTGLAAGTLIGIGAASAALGSIVSQGVGVATGLQDKFSWKGVALAAIGGAVSAGLGPEGLLGKGGLFGGTATVNGVTSTVTGALGTVSNVVIRAGLNAAVGNAISQGLGVVSGLQKKFDWAGVAAAGVGAAVGSLVGGRLRTAPIATDQSVANISKNLVTGAAGGIASAATRSLIEGSDFGDNLASVLPGVVGQTIGELIGAKVARAIDSISAPRVPVYRAPAPGPSKQDEAGRTGATSPTTDADNQAAAVDGQCFVAGTLVHTVKGLIPIEDIRVGEWVLSRDENDINTTLHRRQVTEIFVHTDKPFLRITFRIADGSETELSPTSQHPFYVDGQGWVPAGELMPGDRIVMIDGSYSEVIAIDEPEERADVFNFSVSTDHTYFVGTAGFWVHNDYYTKDGRLIRTTQTDAGRFIRRMGQVQIPNGIQPEGARGPIYLEQFENGRVYRINVSGQDKLFDPALFVNLAAERIANYQQNGGTVSQEDIDIARWADVVNQRVVQPGNRNAGVDFQGFSQNQPGQVIAPPVTPASVAPTSTAPTPIDDVAPPTSQPEASPIPQTQPAPVDPAQPDTGPTVPPGQALRTIGRTADDIGRLVYTRNPLLMVEWYNFQSAVNGKAGFSGNLVSRLENSGIRVNLTNMTPPGSMARNAGGINANNFNGTLGVRQSVGLATQRGFTEVPGANLSRNGGTRVIDAFLISRDGHPRNFVDLEIESKVGYRSDSSQLGPGKVRSQLLADADRLASNGSARTLGVVADRFGRVVRPVGWVVDGYQIVSAINQDGGTFGVNAQRTTSGVAGSVVGGAGGAWAGAAVGAAVGSVVPIVGTAAGAIIGGLIGGFVGGSAGEYAGRETYNAVSGR